MTRPFDLSKANYVVVFESLLSPNDKGYAEAGEAMMQAVEKEPGFVAAYSARDNNGVGITNSYWTSLEAISHWKNNKAHQAVQEKGKKQWYDWYQLQVCEILRRYEEAQ